MSERRRLDQEEHGRKAPPKLSFGGLPASLDDMGSSVTADFGSGVARSMGSVTMLGPSISPSSLQTNGPAPSECTPPPKVVRYEKSRKAIVSSVSHSIARSRWNITDTSLPNLPAFHPLERTAVFVPHTFATVVASRMSEVLRERSIAATFNNAKAKAKCVTPDNVEFCIRLYRGKKKFDHGVIVEVQRRRSFSVNFHADTIAVLDAAEGKMSPPVFSETLKHIMPCLVSDTENQDDELSTKRKRKSTLSLASGMLEKRRNIDTQVLALESLASLTDPAKMGTTISQRVSRKILSNEGGEVRDAVMSLVTKRRLASDETMAPLVDDVRPLRFLAMTILSNAISVESSSAHFASKSNQAEYLAKKLLPIFLEELKNAHSSPSMGALACRCLQPLLLVGSVAASAQEQGALEALSTARQVGEAQIASLASTARQCINIVESC